MSNNDIYEANAKNTIEQKDRELTHGEISRSEFREALEGF